MTAPDGGRRGSQGGRGRATRATARVETPRTVSMQPEFVLHDSAAQRSFELLERQKGSPLSRPRELARLVWTRTMRG